MKLNLTRPEAILIAYAWAAEQSSALDCYGGYTGELYVVRDRLVSFINCNGEKYDGPCVTIMSKEEALENARDRLELCDTDCFDDEGNVDFKLMSEYECSGQDVASLASYLMKSDGAESAGYSAGSPYKEDAVAVKRFAEACK